MEKKGRGNGVTSVEHDRIVNLYQDGVSVTDISTMTGRDSHTIRNRLKMAGVYIPRRDARVGKTRNGNPCKICGGTLRYISGGNCVPCNSRRIAAYKYARNNRDKQPPPIPRISETAAAFLYGKAGVMV